MKVVQINAVCGTGSTGKICVGIKQVLDEQGIENYILYTNGESEYGIKYAKDREIKYNAAKAKILGNYGFNSKQMTKRLINELEKIDPDIVHLHNLHGHNCNLEMLFTYLKDKKIVWTFHDCWAFTGYCMHFDYIKCSKWKSQCANCPQAKEYSLVKDNCNSIFDKKKELFSGLDLHIVTPSKWMAGLVKESFLGDYPMTVINNGIDLEIFKPRPSDFREKYGLQDKKIILGVAFDWGIKKGLDVFIDLSQRLSDEYKIVLVGTTEDIDKLLPDNVLSIHRTNNQIELAEIYTTADVFVNPTREDTFPTVNIESLACGTPVLTFQVGGSQEIIDEFCGAVLEKADIDKMLFSIDHLININDKNLCISRANAFDETVKLKKYMEVYTDTVKNN